MNKYNIKFYNGLKKVVKVPMKLFFDIEVSGLENLPQDNYILAGNHKSIFDMPLLGVNIPDNIHFMAKKELFDNAILSSICSKLGAFPVDRDNIDLNAIKTALRILKSGEVLGIFPEGTRNKTDKDLLPFKSGVVKLASKSNKLIVPFGISGEYKLGKKVCLNIGDAIDINKIKKEEQTLYLEEKVKELILR